MLLGWSFLPYHERNKPQNTVDLFTCRRGSAGAGATCGAASGTAAPLLPPPRNTASEDGTDRERKPGALAGPFQRTGERGLDVLNHAGCFL